MPNKSETATDRKAFYFVQDTKTRMFLNKENEMKAITASDEGVARFRDKALAEAAFPVGVACRVIQIYRLDDGND